MKRRKSSLLRTLLLVLLTATVTLTFGQSRMALAGSSNTAPKAYGRVASVTLSQDQETVKAFSLVHAKIHYQYRVKSATEFIPRSSSADIDGFATGDYAYVLGSHGVASSVEFDVKPFRPGAFEHVTGKARSKPNQNGLFVLIDALGKRHKVWQTPKTSYYINSQPQPGPFQIKAGMNLTVFAQDVKSQWRAFSIDEKVSSGSG